MEELFNEHHGSIGKVGQGCSVFLADLKPVIDLSVC